MPLLPSKLLPYLVVFLTACHAGDPAAEADGEAATSAVRALVTVGHVRRDTLTDVLHLTAVTSYPAKDILRATTTGYVLRPVPVPGQRVRAGETVFRLQTKESRVLNLYKITGDAKLKFNGIIPIKAGRDGIVSTVDKLGGDYVQDGEQLGQVYDMNRFGFVLDVPLEVSQYVHPGQAARLHLPDGRTLAGQVAAPLPASDLAAQTQRYTLRPVGPAPQLPENLVVQVELNKTAPHPAQTLPRDAVLSDETQTTFWVMRLLNDSVAVKVPVKIGLENAGRIEIRQPDFAPQARILLTGNYGLDDTARVQVSK